MKEFKKRQPTPHTLLRFFVACAGTLTLFLLTVVVARAAWGMYDTFKIAVEASESAKGQLETLKSDQARLTAAVEALDTPQGLEKEMRDRFGVARPGEGEIRIIRDGAATSTDEGASQNFIGNILRSLFIW